MDTPFSSLLPPASKGGKATKGGIDRKRKLAETMMRGAYDTSPVQHWTQGAARLAQALAGGMQSRRADAMEAERNRALMEALSGNPDPQTMMRMGAEYQEPTLLQAGAQAWQRGQQQSTPEVYFDSKTGQTVTYGHGMETQVAPAPEGYQVAQESADNPGVYSVDWGKDAQGNDVRIATFKDGTQRIVPTAPGVTLSGPGAVAQDKAIGTEVGQSTGTAIANWDEAVNTAQQAADNVRSIIKDPSLPTATGSWQGGWGAPVVDMFSQGAANVRTRLQQLEGGVFLRAFNVLKGGGQITQVEGEKATQALARIKTTQDEKEITKALNEYLYWLQQGMAKLAVKAGKPIPEIWVGPPPEGVYVAGQGAPTTPQPPAAPQDDLDALLQKYQ